MSLCACRALSATIPGPPSRTDSRALRCKHAPSNSASSTMPPCHLLQCSPGPTGQCHAAPAYEGLRDFGAQGLMCNFPIGLNIRMPRSA